MSLDNTLPIPVKYWKDEPTQEDQDLMIRDLIMATSTHITPEQMREIEQDAPWIRLTDDGIEYSRGMVELLQSIFNREKDVPR